MRVDLLYGNEYVTVPNNYITELSQEASLFAGETFYLGSTVCRSFKLAIDKRALNSLPDDGVELYEGNTKYATLVIDNIDDDDVRSYKFELTDRMVRLNNPDTSWYVEGQTIQQLLSGICTLYGLAGVDTIAEYGSIPITWFDNWTARDFVSWVAELLGGYAYISANNYLKFAQYSNTPTQTISVADCDSFKLGEQITIDRVVYDSPRKTVKYPEDYSGTGCTLYLNVENELFTDSDDLGISIEDQVEYIYNIINGFSFYNVTVGKCPINASIRAGQCIGFSLDNEVYNTIAQVSWNYNSMWLGGYELGIDSPVQQETQIASSTQKTLAITQKIDREIGAIEATIESIESSIQVLDGDMEDAQGQIQVIVNDISNVTQRADLIEQSVTQVETNIADNYYTKTETNSKISQSATSITTTFTTTVENAISGEVQRVSTMIRESGDGIAIGMEGNKIEGRFDNDSLYFVDTQDNDKELAWVDADEGLGGSQLAVGDPNNIGNRWRIYTRDSGSHLTFTRHS